MSAREPTSSNASDPAAPFVGTVLKSTYQVVRKIAEGGMGTVYEGQHVRLKRRVAIKVLLSEYARHPELLARFSQEAEIVGSLGHPHIVQVFDVDETDRNVPYLVMEYLEGETLAERLLRERRLPLDVVVRVVEHVASALAATHEKGIVHRDLKPENVFLVRATGEKDFAKVLDFGVSKMRSAGRRITAQNMVIGTPAYMAPEQARAHREVDHRVDQFALGAMTYEMLAGRSPFPGDDPAEVMLKVITEDPVALSRIAPWVPAAVERVVERALAKNVEDRYPSVSDFSDALRRAAASVSAALTLPGSDRPGPAAAGPGGSLSDRPTLPRSEPPLEAMPRKRSEPPAEMAPRRRSEPPLEMASRPRSRPPTPIGDRPSAPYHDGPSSSPPGAIDSSPDNWIDRIAPVDRRTPSPPLSRPASRPPASASARSPTGSGVDRVPTPLPPPVSMRASARFPSSAPRGALGAEKLAEEARNAFRKKSHDDAVLYAEQLLELALFGSDPAVLEVLRQSMPLLEQIFDARVGPRDARLEVTILGRDPETLNLSPKAAFILSCAKGGATVQEILDSCGIPRRDAIRMLAGLMRRGALSAE